MSSGDALHTPEQVHKRIDRLVDRILQGLCVPFWGAGISLSASHEGSEEDPPTLSAVKLSGKLREKLHHHFEDSPVQPPAERSLRMEISQLDPQGKPKRELDRDAAFSWHQHCIENPTIPKEPGWEKSPSLGEIAELCWEHLGQLETCKLLRLQEWHRFQPTPAHRMLAFLVREGLLTEILETNYDELVEVAVRDTFGKDSHRRDRSVVVIRDLETYRNHSATPRDHRTHTALVKVIKLNGCAGAFRTALEYQGDDSARKQEAAAQRIILTEQALQTWGEKVWAKDLISDRVRSRSLLFIGFAGQDPIVRHHAVQVLQEFQALGKGDPGGTDWHRLPNSPFVAEFKPTLSFYQYQMLRAFRDAHVSSNASAQQGSPPGVFNNAFVGHDGGVFGSAGELPANGFLPLVARRALVRHIRERYLTRESPVGSYLRAALLHPWAALSRVRQRFFSDPFDEQTRFGKWLVVTADQPCHWASACFALQGKEPGQGGYRPMLDSPIKQNMLLVLLALMPTSADDLPAGPGWVGVTAQAPNRGERSLYATSDFDRLIDAEGTAPRLPTGSVVLMLGRGSTEAFSHQLRIRKPTPPTDSAQPSPEPRDAGVIELRSLYAVGDIAALRAGAPTAIHLPEAVRHLEELRRDPEAFVQRGRGWRKWCEETI